jgi:hypothetical protein
MPRSSFARQVAHQVTECDGNDAGAHGPAFGATVQDVGLLRTQARACRVKALRDRPPQPNDCHIICRICDWPSISSLRLTRDADS